MPGQIMITDIHFASAPAAEVEGGLLGWIACTCGSLRLDGLALRRTTDGRVAISFPARRDSSGRQHPFIKPLNDDVRRDVEHQILAALGIAESKDA